MRKWWMTAAVVGASGVGAFLLTEKGKESLRRLRARLEADTAADSGWDDSARQELERIQGALNRLAESLEPHGQMGH